MFYSLFADVGVDSEGLAGHGAAQISQVYRSALGHRPGRDRVFSLLIERRGGTWPQDERVAASAVQQERERRRQQEQLQTTQVDVGNADIRSSSECRPGRGVTISRQLGRTKTQHVSSVLGSSAAAEHHCRHTPVATEQGSSSLEEGLTYVLTT